jgi:hypothetical protein
MSLELCNAIVEEIVASLDELIEVDGLLVMPDARISMRGPPILVPQNPLVHSKHLFRYKVSKKKVESDDEEEETPKKEESDADADADADEDYEEESEESEEEEIQVDSD